MSRDTDAQSSPAPLRGGVRGGGHDRLQARQELADAAQAMSMAGFILRPHLPLIERYMKERDLMDSLGPIINPSLYKSSERQATDAIMSPIFQAAAAFVATLDNQSKRAREALEKVR